MSEKSKVLTPIELLNQMNDYLDDNHPQGGKSAIAVNAISSKSIFHQQIKEVLSASQKGEDWEKLRIEFDQWFYSNPKDENDFGIFDWFKDRLSSAGNGDAVNQKVRIKITKHWSVPAEPGYLIGTEYYATLKLCDKATSGECYALLDNGYTIPNGCFDILPPSPQQ